MYVEDQEVNGIEDNLAGFDDEQVLEGLGRIMNTALAPAQKKVAKAYATKKIKAINLSKTLTREQRFFNSMAVTLDAETRKMISEGQLSYSDADYYLRRQISGTSIVTLLEASNVITPGTTNIDKNYLPKYVNLVLAAIRLGYGADAVATDPSVIGYTNAVDANPGGAGNIPIALLNAEFEIFQDGKAIVSLPVARFFRENFSVGISVQGNEDSVHLKALKLIKETTPFEIKLRFPNGTTTLGAGLNHFIEVRLMGLQSKTR